MNLNECIGPYFIKDGGFVPAQEFDPAILQLGRPIYEVIRLFDGKPLFFADHMERFTNSLRAMQYDHEADPKAIRDNIRELCKKNGQQWGNVKIVLAEQKPPSLFIYFIQHKYPEASEYSSGVALGTLNVERGNPHIKAVNLNVRGQTTDLMEKNGWYEVVLVDHSGEVTEGSKSNIFFIDGDKVYTPPLEKVLPGITRKYVFLACGNLGIPCLEKNILAQDIGAFQAAFLSGTSPKVLPVKEINGIAFQAAHPVLKKIMGGYNALIQQNITGEKE
jgi:branched-chain amino acid aminotransferase